MPWLGLLALFLGVFSTAYFTGGTAVFLGSVEAETLPWLLPLLYLVSGLAAFAVRWGFSALLGRLTFPTLALGTLGLLLSLDLLFVLAIVIETYDEGFPLFVAAGLFVSLAPVLTAADLLFWTAALRLYGPPQVQRHYGGLSRRVLGATLLGFVHVLFSMVLANEELNWDDMPSMGYLFAAAGVALALSAVTIWRLARLPARQSPAAGTPTPARTPPEPARRLPDAYFLVLAGLVLVAVLTHYLVDMWFLMWFLATFQAGGGSMLALAGFLATFFFLFKVAEVAFRFLLAGWLSRRFGPTYGVQVLPIALAVSFTLSLLFFLDPTAGWDWSDLFWLPFLLKGLEVLFRGPVLEPSFGVLLQPLPANLERAARRRIVRVVRPLGVAVAGSLLLLLGLLPDWGPEIWIWSLVAVVAVFLVLSFAARGLYQRRIRSALVPSRHKPEAAGEGDAAQPIETSERGTAIVRKVLPLFLARV